MITVLVPASAAVAGQMIELDADEVHHLRVRRVAAGERLALRDGEGLAGAGTLRLDGKRGMVDVESADRVPRPAPLALLVGAGDRERFGWLAEKAAEVGVSELVPVTTTLTAGVASRLRPEQVERIGRRALEATKQSGAAWAPVVRSPRPFLEAIAEPQHGTYWLADADGEPPPASLPDEAVTVLVGPEGGLVEAERVAAVAAGFRPIRLAGSILRYETAALAAAIAVHIARERGLHG